MNIKEYTDDEGVTHVDVEQVSTGGFKNLEERKVDWTWRDKQDRIFGKVRGRSRFCKVNEIEDAYLKEGWGEAFLKESDGEVIQAVVESVDAMGEQWSADQVWGFEEIEGHGRRHVRHIVVKRGDQVLKLKTVYDWREE